MSWQAYIDTSLLGTGHVDQAAIFSKDGKDVWARSPGFKISPDEMAKVLNALSKPDDAYASGLKIDGQKYTVITVSPTSDSATPSLIAKKGKEGLVVAQTQQALILAHHPEDVLSQSCNVVVETLASYLIGLNY